MAANKFASMLHSNTNKITLILIYAVLEWTLIFLLLLNSLFSFLIIKFSQYFALKPPCLWCSTLHPFFEPQKINPHRDLLCELHSKEVSNLGFCSNHQKLAEIKGFCEDCLSSHLGFQSEVKQSDGEDEDEVILKCSCCGLKFEKKRFDDSSLIRNSWDVLEYAKNGDLIMGIKKNRCSDDRIRSDFLTEHLEIQNRGGNLMSFDGKDVRDSNSFEIETDLNRFEKKEDSTSDFLPQDLEFFFDFSGNRLVPIELVDSTTEESQNTSEADEEQQFGDYQKAQVIQEHQNRELESMELEETENSLVFHAKLSDFTNEKSAIIEETQAPFIEELQENVTKTEEFDSDIHSVHEEAEVSIGTEIPVLHSCDEEPSINSHDMHLKIENGFESKNLCGNHNEIEEEKVPDTPGSIESLNQLHKKLLMIEGKESGVEESFDGSVMSELDGGDPINTAEKLKSALKAERKALNALYAELEEERGASAVAASETMAMINRLQEEKAAMQMEALQYQRMMEEQSEYDQEALQLLNELMMKREKELEMYRKKVVEHEAKEQMRFLRGSVKSGTCSASCSHSEDGDRMPIEMSHELNTFEGNRESWHPNAPDDVVLDLESSLADFEEERLSILEQLKVLEEKLFALSDEEDQHFADVRPIEDFYEENGKHYEFNGVTNGFSKEANGNGTIGSTEKRLLPLFDAISTESDDGVMASNRHENGFHSDKLENDAITRLELEKKRIDIELEVDQVYGRLQALEADREFLKHCIGSLKKGDKGMELLQEILQHLRDLRNVDLRAKTFTDETLV